MNTEKSPASESKDTEQPYEAKAESTDTACDTAGTDDMQPVPETVETSVSLSSSGRRIRNHVPDGSANGKNTADKKHYVPVAAAVFFVLGIISAGIYIACLCSSSFADWFNLNISSFTRRLFANITYHLDFSLAETLFIVTPVIAVILIIFCFIIPKRGKKQAVRFLCGLLAVLCAMGSVFVVNFAAAYRGSTLKSKLALAETEKSADTIAYTALWIATSLAAVADQVDFLCVPDENGNLSNYRTGFSVMPYSFSEMNDKLLDAYDTVAGNYDFITNFRSKVKPIMLSEPMSYTHITGVYSFYTGEANINVNFPDYTLPFTAAHELAHQRGIAKEDEANFMAFLVCISSDDPYIRYSGLLTMYEYISGPLYNASTDYFSVVYSYLPRTVIGELRAYNEFFSKYENSPAADVSGAVNDTYLKSQGTEGTVSYDLVVDLAVDFYYSIINPQTDYDTAGDEA